MKRYVFRLYHLDDMDDGSNVWVEANSWEEAESEVRREYHSIGKLTRISCK